MCVSYHQDPSHRQLEDLYEEEKEEIKPKKCISYRIGEKEELRKGETWGNGGKILIPGN